MRNPAGLAGDRLAGKAPAWHSDLVPDRSPQLPSQRVTDDLRRRIESGEWEHGEQLPAVGQLSKDYGAARRTITKSLRVLADEGLLTIMPNWGTFRAEK